MDFVFDSDSETTRSLQATLRRYVTAHRKSPQEQFCFNRAEFDALAELGLTGMAIPETLGGSALAPFDIAATCYELARGELGTAVYFSVHCMVAKLISAAANNELHHSVLQKLADGTWLGAFCLTEADAGSDAAALKTKATAEGDSFILNGEKIYITSGNVADCFLVFARTDDNPKRGISAFVVPAKTPGISTGAAEKKMGCEGSPICSVRFQNVTIPKAALLGQLGEGYKIALSGLAGGRVNIAAAACGIAARALELSTTYAKERKQFGQAIAEFQAVQCMLADMATKLQASILLTRHAANALLRHRGEATLQASMAKCFTTDRAMEITTDAVQIFGGAGYLRDYEVERLMRDAKMLQIVEGTNQIQRLVIARTILTP